MKHSLSSSLLVISTSLVIFACGPTQPFVDEIPGLLGGKADGDGDAPDPPAIPGISGIPMLPDVNPPKMLPAYKTDVEANSGPGEGRPYFEDPRDSHPSYTYAAAPNDGGYLPGEYEPVQALLIGWANGASELQPMFVDLIAATAPHVTTVVYVNSNYQASQIYNALDARGADPDQVSFQQLDIDTIWMRDYGPLLVKTATGYRVVDPRYYYGRWADDSAPTTLAGSWGVPVSRPALDFEGGNFQSDGTGTCITTTWMLEQNQFRNYTTTKVRQILKDHLGCDTTLILPVMQGEGTGHVDMYVTITGPKEAIVGEYATIDDPVNAQITDQGAQMLIAAGFTVRRIPMPTNVDGAFRSYTNSLAVGNMVLVPVYADDTRYQSQALNVFSQAYPGRTIIPIDSTEIIQWAGAVHCVTMTLAK